MELLGYQAQSGGEKWSKIAGFFRITVVNGNLMQHDLTLELILSNRFCLGKSMFVCADRATLSSKGNINVFRRV